MKMFSRQFPIKRTNSRVHTTIIEGPNLFCQKSSFHSPKKRPPLNVLSNEISPWKDLQKCDVREESAAGFFIVIFCFVFYFRRSYLVTGARTIVATLSLSAAMGI